jgi:hypothetical protein
LHCLDFCLPVLVARAERELQQHQWRYFDVLNTIA